MAGFWFYTLTQFWKAWLFLKLTVGIWDEELVQIFGNGRTCTRDPLHCPYAPLNLIS